VAMDFIGFGVPAGTRNTHIPVRRRNKRRWMKITSGLVSRPPFSRRMGKKVQVVSGSRSCLSKYQHRLALTVQ